MFGNVQDGLGMRGAAEANFKEFSKWWRGDEKKGQNKLWLWASKPEWLGNEEDLAEIVSQEGYLLFRKK